MCVAQHHHDNNGRNYATVMTECVQSSFLLWAVGEFQQAFTVCFCQRIIVGCEFTILKRANFKVELLLVANNFEVFVPGRGRHSENQPWKDLITSRVVSLFLLTSGKMELFFERADLLQLDAISNRNTMHLLPLGKKRKQKLVIGDDTGHVGCYEFKKGEPVVCTCLTRVAFMISDNAIISCLF